MGNATRHAPTHVAVVIVSCSSYNRFVRMRKGFHQCLGTITTTLNDNTAIESISGLMIGSGTSHGGHDV